MSTSVEIRHVGDERRMRKKLKWPATYQLGDGAFLILKRPGSMECTEEWRTDYYGRGYWHEKAWHHETLQVEPTLWERIVALFWRKQQPLPRAVLINTKKTAP